ncbi:MAG: hypothetical protein AMXMBFR84_35110 [Candidatus Hydrogenedentota bacterium]
MGRKDLTFRVFVSSTFSDLIAERNALQEKVFPALRTYCQQRGARFQAIDLRWGVSSEASLDQQTMNICIQELERCQELSPKPNFIVLLGERYGWRPLPWRVPAKEFEDILAAVPEPDRALISTDSDVPSWIPGRAVQRIGWYRKDLNAVPHEYVLQPRTIDYPDGVSDDDKIQIGKDESADWHRIEAEMRRLLLTALDTLGVDRGTPMHEMFEKSATHQEIDHGALHESLDADRHVYAYFRTIDKPPADGAARGYVDGGMDKADLDELSAELKKRLPVHNAFEYSVAWDRVAFRNQDPRPKLTIEEEPDLTALCNRVEADLKAIIDSELDAYKNLAELEREKESHQEFGQERSLHFIGRDDELARIERYLNDRDDRKPLVVHGVSGSGKTALMARAWLTKTNPEQAVMRFIGATPGSADLRSLLRSLCEQLEIETPPTEMNDLVKAFRERLAGSEQPGETQSATAPAVVFLDALDQLNPTDNARMLYWLPRELASGVKLVLSVLEGETSTAVDNRATIYGPFDVARRIWPESLLEVGRLAREDGARLLDAWLQDEGRTLQAAQRTDILQKFGVDGRPLYLKVAFEEAKSWRSWSGLPCGSDTVPGLEGNVEGILVDMLHRIEDPRHHGRLLVERALGNIAASKNGLTEDELVEILSQDDSVMNWFCDQSPTEREKKPENRIKQLPVVIWSRLFADLRPYMVQRRADGTVVMNFYHRQVGEAVAARYFGSDEAALLAAHVRLGDYFAGLDFWAESLDAQRARAKRLPPTPRPANVRKVVELPYHRLEAAKIGGKDDANSPYWDAVAELLLDWQFLEAKAEADPNFVELSSDEPPSASVGANT